MYKCFILYIFNYLSIPSYNVIRAGLFYKNRTNKSGCSQFVQDNTEKYVKKETNQIK